MSVISIKCSIYICWLALAMLLAGCVGDELRLALPAAASTNEISLEPFVEKDAICCEKERFLATIKKSNKPPLFDVGQTCRNSVKMLGEAGAASCKSSEKLAEVSLRRNWDKFPSKNRDNCVKQSTSFSPSYVETLTCLELDRDAIRKGDALAIDVNPQGSTIGSMVLKPKQNHS